MKKILKIVIGVVICIYLIMVVFTTAFLLNRNEYGVSKFAGRYLLLVDQESLEPTYKEHALLFIKPVDKKDIEIGETVFVYDTYGTDHKIKYTEVTQKEEVNDNEITFTLKDNTIVSSQYVLGTEDSTTALNGFGKILYVIQSKWGFLFIVVFPLFLAFIYEIYAIYKELKNK